MMALLTVKEIDQACKETEAYMREKGINQKEIIRINISLEEALLRFQEQLGSEADFVIERGMRMGNIKIRLSVRGPMLDPFAPSDSTDSEADYMRSALIRMGDLPRWSYDRGQNVLLFTMPKKRAPDWLMLLIAISLAILFGLLSRLTPDAVRITIMQNAVSPLLDTFLGLLNAIAGPMVFLSVVWSIYSIGNATTFSMLGKKLAGRYAAWLGVCVPLIVLMSRPFFSLNPGAAQWNGGLSALYQMLLDIVPDNLFTPFSRGNTLQILFIAIAVGVTMIVIGEKTQYIAALAEQMGYVVNGFMDVVNRLIPLFVFGSLFNIIAGNDLSVLRDSGKIVLGAVLGCAFITVLHIAYTSIRSRISPGTIWKNSFSAFLIGLTTASSTAAFADNRKTCTDKYHINPKLVNFAIPFGQILYAPGFAIMFYFSAIGMAERSGIPVSLSWFVSLVVISIVLSSAVPPITGGATASFSILFAQLGLPMASLSVILSLNTLLDYWFTATEQICRHCVMLNTAKSLGMIDGDSNS